MLPISGLQYVSDYLNAEQERELLQVINQQPWRDDLKRRVQHYGYVYDYKARAVDPSMYLGPLPDWAKPLATLLRQQERFPQFPDQLIVNEYQPGQGISAHVDCEPCFENTIASITLGSGCTMDFTSLGDGTKHPLYLEPRSLVVMQDEARYQWRHSIAARKSDQREGQRVPRSRRVSLTFRKVRLTEA